MITLHIGERYPVYAVFLYAKNERENLSPGQQKALMRLVTDIKARTRAGQ